MSKHVNTPTRAYNADLPAWEEADALLGGTRTMRAAGDKYLPKQDKESDKKYKARLNRSWLYNVFRSTIDSMVGKPFERDPQVEMQGDFYEMFVKDVDREGVDLESFAKNLTRQVLAKGKAYILVDHPAAPEGKQLSKAEEREMGMRPYWAHIHPQNLIGWETTIVGGAKVLTQVRIRESVDVSTDAFKEEWETQVRVIYPDRFEVWRKPKNEEEWVIKEQGARNVDRITLVPVYARQTEFMRSEPPLKPLAEKNIEHWQSSSDQRNILHVARVPLLFAREIDLPVDEEGKPTGEVSTGSIITSSSEHGEVKWVELSGDGSLVQGQKDVERLVDEMESLGAQLMFRKADTPKTATESHSNTQKGDSVLHAIVGNVESALNQAFEYTQLWRGDGGSAPTVSLYRDFSVFDPNLLSPKDLLESYLAGAITHEVYLNQLMRRGLDTDLTAEEIMQQLGEEAGNLPPVTE